MLAPKYLQKELALINPMYFVIYNPYIRERNNMSYGKGRWQVKKWKGVFPKKLSLWDTDECEVIMTICKEEVTDRGLADIGYEDVDMRVVNAIRESHWWRLGWKKKVADMDWKNEGLERQANAELEYQSKYVASRVWHAVREPTIHLSGKEWKI